MRRTTLDLDDRAATFDAQNRYYPLDFKAADVMSRHEARLKKQYSTTLKEARDLIETRLKRQDADMREAMTIRRADKVDGCTTNLRKIGFVFSDQQVDAAILAEDTLALAKKVLTQDRVNKMTGYALLPDKK